MAIETLKITGPNSYSESIAIPQGATTIGRAPGSAVYLDEAGVSRHHAEIRRDASSVWIADMGSANGTRVNDLELSPKEWRELASADVAEIGPFELEFRGDSGRRPATQDFLYSEIRRPPLPLILTVTTSTWTRDFELTEPSYTLGRSEDNSIAIDSPGVSRRHARLERRADSFEIIDLDSTNGLVVDGVEVKRKLMAPEDIVRIGHSVSLRIHKGAPLGEGDSTTIVLTPEVMMDLGRGMGSAALDHPQVSQLHARIFEEDGVWVIEDTGSEAGTFVNGIRVLRQPLKDGDLIQLGGRAMRLFGNRLEVEDVDRLSLEAKGLTRVVGSGVTILRDVSVAVQSREFVAIVGPSGAGKTTLLNALCGYQPATSGEVSISGMDLYDHLDAFRHDIGFVPQEDIIHRELNTRRAFDYAARLRMPMDMEYLERDSRIEEVLAELELTPHAETPVRQLSGGQRKRVSIGVELLTQPSMLFLDEATSGLDPGTETLMMRLFRRLADNGRIVVLVTHATKNVMICDKVAFMAHGGYLAFYGPPEEATAYFGTSEFDEIYIQLDKKSGEEWATQFQDYARRSGNNSLVDVPASRVRNAARAPASAAVAPVGRDFYQFVTLTLRSLEILWRSPKDLAALVLLAPFLGALNFLIWDHHLFDPVLGNAVAGLQMLFMLTIVTLLIGSIGSVREIVKEKAIYRRERMVCVEVIPYVASKAVVGGLYAFYCALMLYAMTNLAIDFSYLSPWERFGLFVPIFLATLSGVLLGLLVSAIADTEERAMFFILGVIVPQFLLSGGMIPVKHFWGLGPLLTLPATAKWALAAMVTTSKVKVGPCATPDLVDCRIPGLEQLADVAQRQSLLHTLMTHGQIYDVNLALYWGAMVALVAIALALIVFAQKRKDII